MPGPLAKYQAQVEAAKLVRDPAQLLVAHELDALFDQLRRHEKKSWWPTGRTKTPKGIYLVGSVGRGKTHLMDLLVESLQEHQIRVWRIHFHPFMAHIHEQLAILGGQRDPLASVAKKIAQNHRVLCFDECHVEDIGDAMILGELLHHLFAQGVVLVTTSNQTPDELYRDGLQRARFLPAIEAIKKHCRIVRLDSENDHRLRALTQAPTYLYPITPDNLIGMSQRFVALSGQEPVPQSLVVQGRVMQAMGIANSVAWFDFGQLCQTNRAVGDYSELFDAYKTVLISGVPTMGSDDDNAAKRFVHLVDTAYDRQIKLVLLAADVPQSLYAGQRLKSPFERTTSRLIEMQSKDYLEKSSR